MNSTEHYDIHDYVSELTTQHTHRERYEIREGATLWTKNHVTMVPSLISQLLGATPAGSGEESGSGTASSRPAARIEAIDTVMLIDDEASRWIKKLGEDDPGDTLDTITGHHIAGSGTIACIVRLHALHASAKSCDRVRGKQDCCTRHHIEHDIRRWWHQARIVSGWDSPAWRPDNSCPVCEQRRSLRVNLNSQTAVCVECRSLWTTEEIGLLAEWIRTENVEDDTPADEGAHSA